MRILIVMDSFKGNISGLEASESVAEGVKHACPWADIRILPIADGGEGTVEVFVSSLRGSYRSGTVRGPLGEPLEARWGLLPDRGAVIELAAASGLPLVPFGRRNPLHTTTFGTGQQLRAALDADAKYIVIGLGGSATNDGGMGILAALGVRFLDFEGRELDPVGKSLREVCRIDLSGLDPRVKDREIMLACDVRNRLCGPQGAAAVFGPQKGAGPAAIRELDEGLANFARCIAQAMGRDVTQLEGGGAAGGTAAGLAGILGARVTRGIDVMAKVTGLDREIRRADLIFTGEGRIDSQTSQGKVISGLAERARAARVPLVALVGCVRGHMGPLMSMGLTAVFPITSGPCSTAQSFQRSREDLSRTASQVVRLMRGTLRHHRISG